MSLPSIELVAEVLEICLGLMQLQDKVSNDTVQTRMCDRGTHGVDFSE
ncbi:MAG: hypothetical protein KDA65_10550 [Planctomycetaceae bacterium]|nr:hypothetical protein [Planctomycetaceae bacterium]